MRRARTARGAFLGYLTHNLRGGAAAARNVRPVHCGHGCAPAAKKLAGALLVLAGHRARGGPPLHRARGLPARARRARARRRAREARPRGAGAIRDHRAGHRGARAARARRLGARLVFRRRRCAGRAHPGQRGRGARHRARLRAPHPVLLQRRRGECPGRCGARVRSGDVGRRAAPHRAARGPARARGCARRGRGPRARRDRPAAAQKRPRASG